MGCCLPGMFLNPIQFKPRRYVSVLTLLNLKGAQFDDLWGVSIYSYDTVWGGLVAKGTSRSKTVCEMIDVFVVSRFKCYTTIFIRYSILLLSSADLVCSLNLRYLAEMGHHSGPPMKVLSWAHHHRYIFWGAEYCRGWDDKVVSYLWENLICRPIDRLMHGFKSFDIKRNRYITRILINWQQVRPTEARLIPDQKFVELLNNVEYIESPSPYDHDKFDLCLISRTLHKNVVVYDENLLRTGYSGKNDCNASAVCNGDQLAEGDRARKYVQYVQSTLHESIEGEYFPLLVCYLHAVRSVARSEEYGIFWFCISSTYIEGHDRRTERCYLLLWGSIIQYEIWYLHGRQ